MVAIIGFASLAVLLSLIQPAPAPPVAALGAGIAAAAAGAVADIAGAAAAAAAIDAAAAAAALAAAGAGAAAGLIGREAEADKLHVVPYHESPADFNVCLGYRGRVKPIIKIVNARNVIINGVPSDCMNALKRWNAQPYIGALNSRYGGSTNPMNETAVMAVGVPSDMMAWLRQLGY